MLGLFNMLAHAPDQTHRPDSPPTSTGQSKAVARASRAYPNVVAQEESLNTSLADDGTAQVLEDICGRIHAGGVLGGPGPVAIWSSPRQPLT